MCRLLPPQQCGSRCHETETLNFALCLVSMYKDCLIIGYGDICSRQSICDFFVLFDANQLHNDSVAFNGSPDALHADISEAFSK